MDDSSCEIKITLWGEKATANHEWHTMPIVAFRALKLGDFGGRSLSSSNSSNITFNPPIPEGQTLFNWISSHNGQLPSATSLSSGGSTGSCV